jgi:hydrogenase nickel incorporation protein HypA/HybF
MHEVSLIRNIFNTLRSELPAKDIPRVKTISISAGVLANVEPILLQNAFEAVVATDSPEFGKASLHVITLPVIIHCDACDKNSEVERYLFVCRHCGLPNNNIVQGDELLISGVEMEDAQG